ncbi:MAG: hypothetical protein Q9208_008244 [Pyrenodesmia sp. 3 TL-2023]
MDFFSRITPEVVSEAAMEIEEGMETITKALVSQKRINSYFLKLHQHFHTINTELPHASKAEEAFAAYVRPSITLKEDDNNSYLVFLGSLLPFCTAMAHFNNILGRQAHAEEALLESAAALEALSKAADKATDQAKKILDQGAEDTTKQRRDNVANLYRDVDNATDDTEAKWNVFKEAAETYAYWSMAHEETTNKLEAFTMNRANHEADIETHKQHIGKLATALSGHNRLHTDPHPIAQTAKAHAVTKATQRALNPEALRATTVFSTVKPGSERHAQRVTKANDDILIAGVQLRDMLAHEASLKRGLNIARHRKNAASMALEAARKEHDKARVTGKASMEAIAAYAKALGEESILTRAYELNQLKWQASERVPDQRYGEVCAWVEGKLQEAEAAGVEDVDGAVREAMKALDVEAEGQGQGGAAAGAGQVEGKKGRKGGKGKKKSKGKGKGKK